MLVITLLSMTVAVVMSAIAWRLAREERRRSDARIAALSSEIFDAEDDPAPVPVNDLFAPDARPRTQASLGSALAIGALVVGSLIILAVVFTGGRRDTPATAADTAGRIASEADAGRPPLELTALGHERHGDQLTVRGLVRNPPGAPAVSPLMAVISVFDRQGDMVAVGRGTVEAKSLGAGVESRFVVQIAGVTDVYRYRVSFALDNRTVVHVDRRSNTVTAQLP